MHVASSSLHVVDGYFPVLAMLSIIHLKITSSLWAVGFLFQSLIAMSLAEIFLFLRALKSVCSSQTRSPAAARMAYHTAPVVKLSYIRKLVWQPSWELDNCPDWLNCG